MMNRRKLLPCLLLLLLAAMAFSADMPRIGNSAVWQPPAGFAATLKAACGTMTGQRLIDCATGQMTKAGASADATTLSREIFKQSHGAIGFMSSFQGVGPVDVAWVNYLLGNSRPYGLFLVNGDPRMIDVEELKLLDRKTMQQSAQFQDLKNQFAKVALFPGDRDGHTWPSSQSGNNGGMQFLMSYPLRNGCPTCAPAGSAIFGWNFDSKGKFQNTTFQGMTPAPL